MLSEERKGILSLLPNDDSSAGFSSLTSSADLNKGYTATGGGPWGWIGATGFNNELNDFLKGLKNPEFTGSVWPEDLPGPDPGTFPCVAAMDSCLPYRPLSWLSTKCFSWDILLAFSGLRSRSAVLGCSL